MDKKKPEWLSENTDGSATVTLKNGSIVTMREPTVGDQIATTGSNEDRELALIGNLCSMSPEEVRALTIANYRRLQTALLGFQD